MRDFTYVDDIVKGIIPILDQPAQSNDTWDATQPDISSSQAPYRIYNIGNNEPVRLLDFIEAIEEALGMEAQKEFLPMQAGDVQATYADVSGLIRDFNYRPSTTVKEGIRAFVDWYKAYYKLG